MTYGELKQLFIGILNNRKLTPSQAIQFIDEGIARCQRELRIPAMEKSVSAVAGVDFNGVLLPTDYLEIIRIENSLGKKLVRRSLDYVRSYNYTDTPLYYARQINKWVLGPTPPEGDNIRVDYYAEFDDLSADTDENLLTIIAPSLPVYAALSLAADFFLDERTAAFEARYRQTLEQLNAQADTDEVSDASVEPALQYSEDW